MSNLSFSGEHCRKPDVAFVNFAMRQIPGWTDLSGSLLENMLYVYTPLLLAQYRSSGGVGLLQGFARRRL